MKFYEKWNAYLKLERSIILKWSWEWKKYVFNLKINQKNNCVNIKLINNVINFEDS